MCKYARLTASWKMYDGCRNVYFGDGCVPRLLSRRREIFVDERNIFVVVSRQFSRRVTRSRWILLITCSVCIRAARYKGDVGSTSVEASDFVHRNPRFSLRCAAYVCMCYVTGDFTSCFREGVHVPRLDTPDRASPRIKRERERERGTGILFSRAKLSHRVPSESS